MVEEQLLKRGRLMYIFEAALEYLISILVAGSFLATLTKELGMSDSLTGILSAIISLGCLFQLLSISIRRTRVKGLVIAMSVANQLLFMLLYVIPLTGVSKPIKTALFVVAIVGAYLLYNMVHPKKVCWLIGLVDDKHRGDFTANKEIVSLLMGMVFSFGMGALVDHFAQQGEVRLAFVICGGVIFLLMLLHSVTMFLTVEKDMPQGSINNFLQSVRNLIKNKKILSVAFVFILYYIANYISTPFYGTYQIGELGLSLTYISAIGIGGTVTRILVSKLWGKYADKTSFASMVEKCLLIMALSKLCVVFATPKTGKIMFMLYHLIHGVAIAGVNSALTNMIFDYATAEQRSDSLAVVQAAMGVAGFLATLCVSPLISHIQSSGNTFLGIPVYAQQVVTVFAVLFLLASSSYVHFVIKKQK